MTDSLGQQQLIEAGPSTLSRRLRRAATAVAALLTAGAVAVGTVTPGLRSLFSPDRASNASSDYADELPERPEVAKDRAPLMSDATPLVARREAIVALAPDGPEVVDPAGSSIRMFRAHGVPGAATAYAGIGMENTQYLNGDMASELFVIVGDANGSGIPATKQAVVQVGALTMKLHPDPSHPEAGQLIFRIPCDVLPDQESTLVEVTADLGGTFVRARAYVDTTDNDLDDRACLPGFAPTAKASGVALTDMGL